MSYIEGEKLANTYKIPFFETSAKNGINIDKSFETISETIFNTILVPN